MLLVCLVGVDLNAINLPNLVIAGLVPAIH
jgi:hypothetical protein